MNSSSVQQSVSSIARRLRRPSSSSSHRSLTTIVGKGPLSSTVPTTTNSDRNCMQTTGLLYEESSFVLQRRYMGSGGGARGARGHGWWVNYRAGKGGRHLQGTYSHLDFESMEEWNNAVFSLGSKLAYIDVKVEALGEDEENENKHDGQIHRLTLELATEALPLATDNVLKLLDTENATTDLGYESSTLHRIEKGVGILGGLIQANPNHNPKNLRAPVTKRKMGICHPYHRAKTSPTAMDISSEKLVLHHLPGVITMLQPRIGEIDSRFMILSHKAPHLDGVSVAVGRLVGETKSENNSLTTLQKWESSLITSHGVPTNVILKIVRCGLLSDNEEASDQAA